MLLYAMMYAAFGVASPFLPAFVSARGLSAEHLGLVLSTGTAVRLLTASLAGRTGDVLQGLRVVLVVCTVLAAAVTLGYLPAHGFWPLQALSLLHAASLGPVTILADALALGAASPPPGKGLFPVASSVDSYRFDQGRRVPRAAGKRSRALLTCVLAAHKNLPTLRGCGIGRAVQRHGQEG
jgi:MFS1 family protein